MNVRNRSVSWVVGLLVVVLLAGSLSGARAVGLLPFTQPQGSSSVQYTLTLNETGLPNSTSWGAEVQNSSLAGALSNNSTTSSVSFSVPNGTYAVSIRNVSLGRTLYAPMPAHTNVTVNGTNVTADVVFTAVSLWELTFSESGLPSGTGWSVGVYNNSTGLFSNGSTTSTVGFLVPNGTYAFTAMNVTSGLRLYVPTPAYGIVTVSGTNVTVNVTFTAVPLYVLTFAETGLPGGTGWEVGVYSYANASWVYGNSTGVSIAPVAPNGAYYYFLPNVTVGHTLYVPAPMDGNVTVNGTNVTVNVTFTAILPHGLTFTETDLPSGTGWEVGVYSDANSTWVYNESNTSSVGFLVPDGTYGFSVGNVTKGSTLYVPTPGSGNVSVNGTNVTVGVPFTAVPLYELGFTETGLPNGTAWSVGVYNTSTGLLSNESTNVTVEFLVPSGTYAFSVGNITIGSTLYVPVTAYGNVTVNGSSMTADVTFAAVPLYALAFAETGLPAGTGWEVGVYSYANSTAVYNGSTNSTVGFLVPDGTYAFNVGNVTNGTTLYVPVPTYGNVTINGTSVTVDVAFTAVPLYELAFNETGLPSGIGWSVGVYNTSTGSLLNGSTNSTVGFLVPDGTYTFNVGNLTNGSTLYVPAPAYGNVTVNGANVTVRVTFTALPLYELTFTERGLPNGSGWEVGVYSYANFSLVYNGSNTSSVGFPVPNGTYYYYVWNTTVGAAEYVPTPMSGNVTVNGMNMTVDVAFTPVPLHELTFLETGLPNATGWGVEVYSYANVTLVFNESSTSSVGFLVPNGTYAFAVGNVTNGSTLYLPTPAVGNVTVNGLNVTVDVAYTAVPLYELTVTETGLPSGTGWEAGIYSYANSTWVYNGSNTTSIEFLVTNGTYAFYVGNVSNGSTLYVPTPIDGNVTVQGTSATVGVVFRVGPLYAVTFTETGLPSGTEWWVNGTTIGTQGSTTTTISVTEANGTYPYTVATADKEYAAVGGAVTVNGAAVPVAVTFALVTYAVTFTESGLPSGTEWWVNVTGQTALESTGSTITTSLSNATYLFTVSTVDKHYAPSYTSSFTVNGAALPVAVTFSLVTYAVTFTETGLSPGTNWSVVVGDVTHYSTGTTIVVTEPNATYVFSVGSVSGYTVQPSSGNVVVDGKAVAQSLTFSSTSKAATFLGLPAAEGYAVVAGIVVVVLVAALAAALMARRRRRRSAPEPATSSPAQENAPGNPPGTT